MAVVIKSNRTWAGGKGVEEWLIKDEEDLDNVADTAGPGSKAYTADMKYVVMLDEDGEWQEIKNETTTETTDDSGEESGDGETTEENQEGTEGEG